MNTVVCYIVHGLIGKMPGQVWLWPTLEAKAKCCAGLFSRSGVPTEADLVKINVLVMRKEASPCLREQDRGPSRKYVGL